ncbi:hypothetical protein BH11PLA1_BH11PLA1_04220 [soil metagenome]
MSRVLALAIKDLRLLTRDRAACFFALLFPIMFAVFFGAIFSRGDRDGETQKLDVVLTDLDRTEASQRFALMLRESKDFDITTVNSEDEAKAAVLGRRALGAIVLPPGFGAAQEGLFTTGQGPHVRLAMDPSRKAESGWLQGLLQQSGYMQMSRTFSDPAASAKQLAAARQTLQSSARDPATKLMMGQLLSSLDLLSTSVTALNAPKSDARPKSAAPQNGSEAGAAAVSPGNAFAPIIVESVPLTQKSDGPDNAWAISFPQGIIWGIMGCALGFAASLAGERTGGTLSRLRAAPLTPSAILLGKGVAAAIATIVVITGMMLVAVFGFKVHIQSFPTLIVSVLTVTFAFVGIMMFAATIGRTEASTNRAGWAIMMVLAMLGGAAVPLFVMPKFIQTLSVISPIRWAIQALEGAIWRQRTIESPEMLTAYAVLIAVGIVGMAFGFVVIQRDSRAA